MFIESLELQNFRNYKTLSLQFDRGTNILFGDNAQGKTNILEAVYLGGTTKSHRGSKDREMIRFGQDEAHIRMQVKREAVSCRIDMHLKKNKSKGIAINGVPIRKASELFGAVNMVFFSPEDLQIIKEGPGERRRFLDLELCQLSKVYLNQLTNYNKILNQRNKLLKDLAFMPDLLPTLEVWDEQLASYGGQLILAREEFVEQLNEISVGIHANLTGEKERLELVYEPNVQREQFSLMLKKNRDKDIRFKLSSVGPHRDDLCVKINGIDIRKYGSQGQQRTAALSLKLSEIYLVKRLIHDTPVLLLDDVLSELDGSRQNYLLQSIRDIQTLITCTGLDDFVSHQFNINRVFRVIDGRVFQNN
ncbi:MAG TPA: DNA replication/repair protein RecF [Candidatus Egerieimonas intestinavium]|uniref:DNA replication and repair protein RecF n=1 Tax=Candidatus Egerieimonas intestinavium TaxID=2840777 RepID=A0A9D1JHG1_9FIRM|nr:DNA replication/repair protein RecF [Candidatus Egerieimonas intestinavium]